MNIIGKNYPKTLKLKYKWMKISIINITNTKKIDNNKSMGMI